MATLLERPEEPLDSLGATAGTDYSNECSLSPDQIENNLEEQKDEILALESIFADTGVIQILSSPDKTDDQKDTPTVEENSSTPNLEETPLTNSENYILQLEVRIPLDEEGITVEAYAPYQAELKSEPSSPSRPQFQRSLSGRRWVAAFKVHHLTPVCLEVTLLQSYPSDRPPMFSMSCLWLTADQMSELCREMDKLWEASAGMSILYSWVDWLQQNLFSVLALDDKVSLVPYTGSDHEDMETVDPRAMPECINLEESIGRLLRYDSIQVAEIFQRSLQTCGICFDEKSGKQFFRLDKCGHHFCSQCLASYGEFHVTEGTVRKLTCPDSKCDLELPQGILQAVLDPDKYQRWERLLLQNALDTMGDIEWCPRCNNAVIRDNDTKQKLASCTVCFYSFCTQCKDPWHQGTSCGGMDDDDDDEDEDSMTPEELAEKRHRTAHKRKSKIHNKQNRLSYDWILRSTKPCPKCYIPIEKNDGCTKVFCVKCGTWMCWTCCKIITVSHGYDHFGVCNLFADNNYMGPVLRNRPEPGVRRVRDHLNQHRDEGQRMVSHCPQCRQRNLKHNRDNHICCWCCHSHFCFLCSSTLKVPILSHFVKGPCVQHT